MPIPPHSPEVMQSMDDNEINLNDLLSKIWGRWKFILALVLISIIVVAGINALMYLKTPPIKTYSESIRFNFPSSIQGKYPSGQHFSQNDLISTSVLKKVYDTNNIQSQKISFSDFSGNFSIAPFASNLKFIQKKFSILLANKKLSPTEIEGLEKNYLNELNAARSHFAKISYVDSKHLGLSPVLIKKILSDVPRLWSSIAIQDLGVLDLKLSGSQFYQPDLVGQYEYLQAIQYMKSSSKRFNSFLKVLQDDELGGFLRDPKTEMVVSDILSRLQIIQQFDLQPLFSIISNLGLFKDKQNALMYLSNLIEVKTDQIHELDQKSQVYKEGLQLYAAYNNRNSTTTTSMVNSASHNALSSDTIQYGDGFLSKIVDMVEQQKNTEYRQGLLSKKIQFSLEMKALTTEQVQLKRAQEVLKADSKQEQNELSNNYTKQIQEINTNLAELISTYQRILDLRNSQLLGKTSLLYELSSSEMMVNSELKSKLKKIVLISIVSGIFALMIAVFISLVVREKN